MEKLNLNTVLVEEFVKNEQNHKDILKEYFHIINEELEVKQNMQDFVKTFAKNLKLSCSIRSYDEGWADREVKVEELNKMVDNFLFPSPEEIQKYRDSIKIYCPICKKSLIFGGRSHLETLDEHVCDPNGRTSKKDYYKCSDESCSGNKMKWLDSGEGPYADWGLIKESKFIKNNSSPFNTFHRAMNASREKTLLRFGIKKFEILFQITPKANNDGIVNYWFSNFHFHLLINNTYYTSGIHMLIFSLRQYSNKFIRKNQFENDYKSFSWDKRWWKRVAFNIASIIYKKDYKEFLKNNVK